MVGKARWREVALAVAFVAGLAGPSGAQSLQPPVVPQYGTAEHLGVASCSSSTCHGSAVAAVGGNVLLNEAVTWLERDKHARAYRVLFDERSQRIARNLGLPDAYTAKICLDCHTDNIAQDRRG